MATNLVKNTDVLIVGGGPVGTVLHLLLNKCGVSNLLVEKRPSLSNRPRAHYISNRSMEVLRHLGHIDKLCQKLIPPLDKWRYISYVNEIASIPIATRDCFSQYYTYNDTYYDPYSPSKVGNLGQNILSLVLNSLNTDNISRYELDTEFELPLKVKENLEKHKFIGFDINFGTKLLSFETFDHGIIATLDGADGIKSIVKKQLGIMDNYIDEYKSYYVAIHFESDELLKIQQNTPSLLKFICGESIGVLVWYHDSEFILHVPCVSLELQRTFDLEKCIRTVSDIIKVDFNVKNYTFWVQNMSLAKSLTDESARIILIGDAAHQLIPSGGFGMNLGINDAYSLYWRLYYLLNKNRDSNSSSTGSENRKSIIQSYVSERYLIANYAIKTAGEAYRAGSMVSSLMGYKKSMAENFVTAARICTSVDNVDRMLKLGTRFINYIANKPLINNIINQNAANYLQDDNCAFRLTYPAADLNYRLIYPDNDQKNKDSQFSLHKYYKMTPTGLKTSKCAWRMDPDTLIGKRIPHCWVYYEMVELDSGDNRLEIKKVMRLSTVDFNSIYNIPTFVHLTFTEDIQLPMSEITPHTLQAPLLHIVWITSNLIQSDNCIKIMDNPLQPTTTGSNATLDHISNSKTPYLRVFSSKNALEQFKIFSGVKSHQNNIAIIIRPDNIVTDILKY